MDSALTYRDFELSLIKILYVEKLEIEEEANKHSELNLVAVLDADEEQNVFYEIPEVITLYYYQNNNKKPMFSGVVVKSSLKKEGGYLKITLEAKGLTYLMDVERKIQTYQDTSESSHQVIDYIASNYPGIQYKKNINAEAIGQFMIQYEETDWTFLKRLTNKFDSMIYPNALSEQMCIQVGLSTILEELKIQECFYICKNKFEDYEIYRQNIDNEIMPQQYIEYEIETYEIMALGISVFYKSSKWYITKAKRKLKSGLLINSYTLSQKESERKTKFYNKMLPGISLDGAITNVSRNKVQIVMRNDINTRNCGQYWFPYSSVSGSSDGTGWHCMPERGENVRVYFPTDDEREAYIISNLSGKTGNSQGGMNPSVRHISTAQGNVVSFSEAGVSLSVKGGAASISLGKSGEISIKGAESITLIAGGKVSMDAKNITIDGQSKVGLANDAGASIALEPSQINVAAVKVYEN